MALIGCGFCKKTPTNIGHEMMKFPTGVIVDVFYCVGCGAILPVTRAPGVEQPRIVKPSTGDIKELGIN